MTEKTKTSDSNIRSQMQKGMLLEYCVLLLFKRVKEHPSDGINGLSEASLIVVEGTLYTLHRPSRRGNSTTSGRKALKAPRENIISSLSDRRRGSLEMS